MPGTDADIGGVGRAVRTVARGALVLVLVFLGATPPPYVASRDPAWRELAARIRPAADDRTTVVLVPPVDCIPLAYYVAPDLLPSLFGPRGSLQPVVLRRRLAERAVPQSVHSLLEVSAVIDSRPLNDRQIGHRQRMLDHLRRASAIARLDPDAAHPCYLPSIQIVCVRSTLTWTHLLTS